MTELSSFSQFYSLISEYNENLSDQPPLLRRIESEFVQLSDLDDEHLAKKVYGTQSNPSTYRSLKSRFKNVLIQDLLLNGGKKSRNSLRDQKEMIHKEYAAMQIAMFNSKVGAAELLARQLLKKAQKYQVTEIVVGSAYHLYQHGLFYRHAPAKTKTYYEIYQKNQDLLQLERAAKAKYGELSSLLRNKRIDHSFLADFCTNAYQLKAQYNIDKGSFDSNRFLYLLGCLGFYFSRDFKAMDKMATEALDYLSELPFRSIPVENQFRRFNVRAQLLQGEYYSGIPRLLQIVEQTNPSTIAWFTTYQLLVQIYLMTGQYREAISAFEKVNSSRGFKSLPQLFKNDWLIMEAYLNFLQLQNPELGKPSMTRFRINRFINNNPELTESKKMYNIQLIVAQLLFYFHDHRYNKIEERISAITRYSSRYLKKNETYRSQVFIKMLAKIPVNNYSRKAIERHTKNFRKRLMDYPSTMDFGIDNVEIIPYEQLWKMILENLKR